MRFSNQSVFNISYIKTMTESHMLDKGNKLKIIALKLLSLISAPIALAWFYFE